MNTLKDIEKVSYYDFLVISIKKLESHVLTVKEQVEIIEWTLFKIKDIKIKTRLELILEKNSGYSKLKSITEIIENLKNFKYFNVTTVDVERSFSSLNILLSGNRLSIKSKNIYGYLAFGLNN